MSRKSKVNVESLSRPWVKKLKKVRETKERQATGLLLLDARQDPLGFTGTLAFLDEMMEETAEEKSRRRSALKYEYFREMTPRGNI